MIPKTQEFIFDMMIAPTLKAIKESGEEGLPLLLCPSSYLHDFIDYLKQDKIQEIFKQTGYFPIIQVVESRLEEEYLSAKNACTQSLILLALVLKENPHISQTHLSFLNQESAELFARLTKQELSDFLCRYIGALMSKGADIDH